MPPPTRWFVRTGLVYLVAALLVGVLITAQPLRAVLPWLGALTPAYFHLFMVGWVTLLIMGVVYWMFPKWTKTRPRGYPALAWAAYGLLNAGLLLRVVAEPALTQSTLPAWRWLVVAAVVLQWLGGMAFVINTWPRVKER
jgi:hypothetical protein